MQPVRLALHPEGLTARHEAQCLTCGEVHPPDTDVVVSDARAWEGATRAANGGVIPVPLPQA